MNAPRFVEETLEYEVALCWKTSERTMRGAQIVHQLIRRRLGKLEIMSEPMESDTAARVQMEALLDLGTKAGDGS